MFVTAIFVHWLYILVWIITNSLDGKMPGTKAKATPTTEIFFLSTEINENKI